MFRFEIKRILGKIILSAQGFCGGALQIHRREIILCFRQPVRHIESETVDAREVTGLFRIRRHRGRSCNTLPIAKTLKVRKKKSRSVFIGPPVAMPN
jgi:hypothetical protein